jgi:HPt (histidine-containing phosphotransfer) domain-containing protein
MIDIDHLISSLDANDFNPAVTLGHQVKGNAATFDFPQIAPLGLQIENAAKNQNKEQVRILVKLMESEIHLERLKFH